MERKYEKAKNSVDAPVPFNGERVSDISFDAVRLLSAGVPIHEVANQLGDTVETVVRNYVQPTAPGQSLIDAAYSVCSRKYARNG